MCVDRYAELDVLLFCLPRPSNQQEVLVKASKGIRNCLLCGHDPKEGRVSDSERQGGNTFLHR